jgi:hypothetical protein
MRKPTRTVTHERDAIVNAQRNAQTIKARSKIRSAPGNANGNFLHT